MQEKNCYYRFLIGKKSSEVAYVYNFSREKVFRE